MLWATLPISFGPRKLRTFSNKKKIKDHFRCSSSLEYTVLDKVFVIHLNSFNNVPSFTIFKHSLCAFSIDEWHHYNVKIMKNLARKCFFIIFFFVDVFLTFDISKSSRTFFILIFWYAAMSNKTCWVFCLFIIVFLKCIFPFFFQNKKSYLYWSWWDIRKKKKKSSQIEDGNRKKKKKETIKRDGTSKRCGMKISTRTHTHMPCSHYTQWNWKQNHGREMLCVSSIQFVFYLILCVKT